MVENVKHRHGIRRLAILGSTGSIGTQSICVARHLGLSVVALAAGRNVALLEEQVRELHPRFCAMSDAAAAKDLRNRIRDLSGITVFSGTDGICEMISLLSGDFACDLAINAIVGGAGLRPTLAVLEQGIPLALANKESLVCAGDLVMAKAREKQLPILPVDSEHSAIFQCLQAGRREDLKKLILTASGGPFFGKKKEELYTMTAEDALAHPTWSMGRKITVDSATMMNKGFEVIEAMHLFSVEGRQIEVVVHRESIVHSMVEFADHSVIAQMAMPDMRDCIQYAITYPARLPSPVAPLSLADVGRLTFYPPDTEAFPLLSLAFEAAKAGGVRPAVMNGANEGAVEAFLCGKIPFGRIAELVMEQTRSAPDIVNPTLSDILAYGEEAQRKTRALCDHLSL